MFRNYLLLGFRNLIKYKVQSAITISGLAIGLTCAILMFLFVWEELSYDRFFEHSDRIYRVVQETRLDNGERAYSPSQSGPMAAALERDFPEVETAVHSWSWAAWFEREGKWLSERVRVVNEDYLKVLRFPMMNGDHETALQKAFSIVTTEQMAKRYFGDENPMGKTLMLDRDDLSNTYTVTGVVAMPTNTSNRFDFLISTVPSSLRHWLDDWQGRQFFETYILLSENASANALEQKLPDFITKYKDDDWAERNVYHLQPLTRIHLYSSADYNRMDSYRGDNITYLYLVSVAGAFVLLIACVNFVNLATARSVVRAREVGIRKVVGAHRRQLVGQFLGESLIVTGLALLLAIGLAELFLPTFNDVSGKRLVFEMDGLMIGGLIGIAVIVGLLSGLYPAVALSGFKPLSVLKGGIQTPLKGRLFRNGLVVFQFSMSVLLIIATTVVYSQVDFMQNKDLGFEKDNVVWLPVFGQDRTLQKKQEDWLVHRAEEVKQAFLAHPNILEAAASRFRGPSGGGRIQQVRVGDGDWDVRVQEVDESFLSVYGIDLVSGRNFTAESTNGFILNETAVRRSGWENPIGQTLEFSGQVGTVIGVVKDYHSRSLHEAIEPVLLCMVPAEYINLSLKIRSEDVPGTLAFLEEKWAQFIPRRPFRVYFMDTWVNRPYSDDRRFAQVASIAAVFAIFVACLGLLGLASFLASRRTKEIGIRKVLGATVSDIVTMLSRDFLKPVVLANVIAWPIAYWAMRDWLDQFVYRIDLSVWPFLGSAVLIVGIAIVTVSVQAIRAARENPVKALRYE